MHLPMLFIISLPIYYCLGELRSLELTSKSTSNATYSWKDWSLKTRNNSDGDWWKVLSAIGSKSMETRSKRSSPSKSGVPTEEEEQEIVDAHNERRRQEGSSDMKELVYNKCLGTLAYEWIKQCKFKHGRPKDAMERYGADRKEAMGQNLATVTRNSGKIYEYKEAIKAWYYEKSDYTYDTNACAPGKVCGHYTQVVWAKTSEVGCARVFCETMTVDAKSWKNAFYIGCNYGPPGNFVRVKPYKKGAACSQCPANTECENDLCRDKSEKRFSKKTCPLPSSGSPNIVHSQDLTLVFLLSGWNMAINLYFAK